LKSFNSIIKIVKNKQSIKDYFDEDKEMRLSNNNNDYIFDDSSPCCQFKPTLLVNVIPLNKKIFSLFIKINKLKIKFFVYLFVLYKTK